MPKDFIAFLIALSIIVIIVIFPGNQANVNKNCVDNGGYVTQHVHYSTCSQDKPGYKNGIRQ